MSLKLKWARPLDKIPFPNVWTEFYERESKDSNKIVKYSIQDISEDRIEEAIDHMTEFYLRDEPWSMAAGNKQRNHFYNIKVNSIFFRWFE